MDRECNIAGRLYASASVLGGTLERVFLVGETDFVLRWIEDSFEGRKGFISISLLDKSRAAELSLVAIENLGKELSLKFKAKVFLYKEYLDYGQANVFNGGSDYEIVSEERYEWTFDGNEMTFKRTLA